MQRPLRSKISSTPNTREYNADWHSVERNARESSLLRLPDELRLRIFQYTIGGSLIHISHFKGLPVWSIRAAEGKPFDDSLRAGGVFRHSLCVAGEWEHEAYDKAVNGLAVIPSHDTAAFHIQMWKDRHQRCKCWEGFYRDGDYEAESVKPDQKLSLTLLGACRKTYEEGFTILWTTNTFSFCNGASFGAFMASLNPAQKKALKKLNLSSGWSMPSSRRNEWTQHLKVLSLKMLKSLATLHLSFNITARRPLICPRDHPIDDVVSTADWFAAFMRFRLSALKTLTVMISDDVVNMRASRSRFGLTLDDTTDRFSAPQKRQIAQSLIARINDPQGAATFWAEEATKHAANVAKRAAEKVTRDKRRRQDQVDQATAQAVEEIANEGVDETVEWEEGDERLFEEEVFQEEEEDVESTDDAANQVEEGEEFWEESEEAYAPWFAAEGEGDIEMEDGEENEEIRGKG